MRSSHPQIHMALEQMDTWFHEANKKRSILSSKRPVTYKIGSMATEGDGLSLIKSHEPFPHMVT